MIPQPSPDRMIGVGPALRKARAHRGLTLEEAARDTKLRTDQLQALENEMNHSAAVFMSEDAKEGIAAFKAKRTPAWKGR